MKNIYLAGMVLIIGTILFFCAGVAFLVSNAWKTEWVKGQSLVGSDGYTYMLIHENGLTQDPRTRLVRTKDVFDENAYEELGITAKHEGLAVIRPAGQSQTGLYQLERAVYFVFKNEVMFVYDVAAGQFYEWFENKDVPPFVLISNEDVQLCRSDEINVICRVVREIDIYTNQRRFLGSNVQKELIPNWPSEGDLTEALLHLNLKIRRIAQWISDTRLNGLEKDTETSADMVDFLKDSFFESDLLTRYRIVQALGCFRNSAASGAIPLLKGLVMHDQHFKEDAARSLGNMGRQAFPTLLEFLESPDSEVRLLGLRGFSWTSDEPEAPLEEIESLLADPATAVQEAAQQTLANLEMKRSVLEYAAHKEIESTSNIPAEPNERQ